MLLDFIPNKTRSTESQVMITCLPLPERQKIAIQNLGSE